MPDFFYVGFGNAYMKVTELFPQSFLYSYTVEMFLSGGSQDHKRAGPWQSHFKSLLYHIHRHPVGQSKSSGHDQCQCAVCFLFLPDKWTQVQSFQTAHIYIPFLWAWSPDMAQGLIVDNEEAMLGKSWPPCSFLTAMELKAGSSIPEASRMDQDGCSILRWSSKCSHIHSTTVTPLFILETNVGPTHTWGWVPERQHTRRWGT